MVNLDPILIKKLITGAPKSLTEPTPKDDKPRRLPQDITDALGGYSSEEVTAIEASLLFIISDLLNSIIAQNEKTNELLERLVGLGQTGQSVVETQKTPDNNKTL